LWAAFVVAVVAALFAPSLEPPEKYASGAIRYLEEGPMPARYAFEVYDAMSGDFLFAIVKSACNPMEPDSAGIETGEFGEARLTRLGDGHRESAVFTSEEREELIQRWQEMDTGQCEVARGDPALTLRSVSAVSGSLPGLPDTVPRDEDGRFLLAANRLGPDRIEELALRVEGDPFEVRAWTGVGQRDGWCPSERGGGMWWFAGGFADDHSNDASDRYLMLCLSYRYAGASAAMP
jgi:hypothetical protein